jgi:hypothetical protein
MKYAFLLFTGLVLVSCGVSRRSGQLRKVKVDRTPRELVVQEPTGRDWEAVIGKELAVSVGATTDEVADELKFSSVQSSELVLEVVALTEVNIETQGLEAETVNESNSQEIDLDDEMSSQSRKERSGLSKSENVGRLKASVIIGIIVICIIAAYLIIFFPSIIWIVVGIIGLLLAIVIYFLFFGPMIYD